MFQPLEGSYDKSEGEQEMKKQRRIIFTLITLSMILLLSACRSEADRNELSHYIGKSVSTFEKRSQTKLEQQSNGAYAMKDVVQVLVLDNKVTSVTLMKNAGKYTLFGMSIGMKKDDAEALNKDKFGKYVSKIEDPIKNEVTYSYLKDEKQLYISYDNDKNMVTELSYYKLSKEEQKAAAKEPEHSGEMMLMVGDTKVYYNEAMVYLKSAQDKYESDYGNGIWDADIIGNGETFGKMIKDEVIKQITELKIIRAEAEKKDITLSEEEQAEANSYALEHFNGITKEDKEHYLITQKLLEQVYSDNLLADKVFENQTINVDNNVSDEQAKQITVQDIFIQNYNLDSEGKKVPLSSDDKKEAYKKAKTLFKKAKDTKDFKALAEANTEAGKSEYTFGKGDNPEEFGDAFEKAAFSLKTGQVSEIITTDTGWHIIYCVSDFNMDATTQVKENIIDQRRNDLFTKIYQQWTKDYNVVVNNEAWNAISLGK